MKKIFYPLKLRDYLTLLGLIILGYGWLLIDQFFFPQTYQRVIALVVILFGLYFLQFLINKPVNLIQYANSIAAITLPFVICMSLIIHVVINHNFTYKSPLIWIISGILPYLARLVYFKTKKEHDTA